MKIRKLIEIHDEYERRRDTLKRLWDRQWTSADDKGLDQEAIEAYKDYKESFEKWLDTEVFGCSKCEAKGCCVE